MKHLMKKVTLPRILLGIIILCGIWVATLYTIRTPSMDREWSLDQQVLPEAAIDGDVVTIKNIRDFIYESSTTYTPRYYDATVRISDIVSVDYMVEPLAKIGVAHTLLSFGFKDGSHIILSVEIRKEIGESFSPVDGALQAFELMYVIMSERDAFGLRAIHRDNQVYLYPTTASPEAAQKLFVSMLNRGRSLIEHPEFYNTFTSTCTTNIMDHINEISENPASWDYRLLLPKDSDALAYELGFIDNSTPLESLREKHDIQAAVKKYIDAPDFSQKIREYRGLTND
jgi:hypothetical protein